MEKTNGAKLSISKNADSSECNYVMAGAAKVRDVHEEDESLLRTPRKSDSDDEITFELPKSEPLRSLTLGEYKRRDIFTPNRMELRSGRSSILDTPKSDVEKRPQSANRVVPPVRIRTLREVQQSIQSPSVTPAQRIMDSSRPSSVSDGSRILLKRLFEMEKKSQALETMLQESMRTHADERLKIRAMMQTIQELSERVNILEGKPAATEKPRVRFSTANDE